MGSGLFFRDSRIGHVSHDRPRAGWAHVAISRRSKSDHYRCPFCFPLFGKRSGTCPRELYAPGNSERKEMEQTLGPGLGRLVSLQFLSFCGVPLHAGRALNAHHIRYYMCQLIVAFWGGATLEVGAANQARRFRFGP